MSDIRCSCGALLIEELDEEEIRIGDEEFRFARSTDYIACSECGALHKVGELRHGTVGGFTQTDEALEVLRELALEDPSEDPARTVGRVPEDD